MRLAIRALALGLLLSTAALGAGPYGQPTAVIVPDSAGTGVTLSAQCATGLSCNTTTQTAFVELAGQQSASIEITTSTAPSGMTLVADCGGGAGPTWLLSSTPASTGLVQFEILGATTPSILNPGTGFYGLVPGPGCFGATHIRVRVAATTSGSVAGTLRAVQGSRNSLDFIGGAAFSLGPQPASQSISVVRAIDDIPIDTPAGPTDLTVQCSSINACAAGSTVSVKLTAQAAASFTWVNVNYTGTNVPDCQLAGGQWAAATMADPVTCATSTTSGAYTGDSTTTTRTVFCPGGSTTARIRASGAVTNRSTVTGVATLNAGSCSLYGDGANNLQVKAVSGSTTAVTQATGTNLHAVIDSGSTTAATQATASNLNAQVVGNAASAAADSGNPVKVGGVVQLTLPTAGTDTQRMNQAVDKFGRQVFVANVDRALVTQATVTLTASTSETTLIAAGGANIFLDLTYLKCSTTAATSNVISVRDVTAGTVRDTLVCPAAIGPCEGAVYFVPFKQTTANSAWTIQAGTSASSVICTAQAVQLK